MSPYILSDNFFVTRGELTMQFHHFLAIICAGFVTTSAATASPALIGHFTFDTQENIGADVSGSSNHADSIQNVGFTSSGISGGAATFSSASNSYLRWAGATNEIANSVAGDFTFSLWAQTTQAYGGDTSNGFDGAGIIYSDIPGAHNDIIPMALTGNKLGFFTGGSYGGDTLHSLSNINLGEFTHIVVTRNLATGNKEIYINGALETAVIHEPGLSLNERQELFVGGNIFDARYFDGALDDLQIYNFALSSEDIAHLYNNPGQALTAVPVPASAWLFGSAFAGLIGLLQRKQSA
jgi:hypothetical protein